MILIPSALLANFKFSRGGSSFKGCNFSGSGLIIPLLMWYPKILIDRTEVTDFNLLREISTFVITSKNSFTFWSCSDCMSCNSNVIYIGKSTTQIFFLDYSVYGFLKILYIGLLFESNLHTFFFFCGWLGPLPLLVDFAKGRHFLQLYLQKAISEFIYL